ncbi:MAG: trxA [Clostridia bacterium]|jgi:thioredoxin 1|nr:trxA [Clostridia bacterium]
MAVLEVTTESFEDEVLEYEGKVLIDFWATWCGPCRMLSPVIDALSEETDRIKFVKVNVDESPETAAKFDVQSIPTVIIIENGKEINRTVGFIPKDALKSKLDI